MTEKPQTTMPEAPTPCWYVKDYADGWIKFYDVQMAIQEAEATGAIMLYSVNGAYPTTTRADLAATGDAINVTAVRDRVKQLMAQVGYPESTSHYTAFMQLANEFSQGCFGKLPEQTVKAGAVDALTDMKNTIIQLCRIYEQTTNAVRKKDMDLYCSIPLVQGTRNTITISQLAALECDTEAAARGLKAALSAAPVGED